MINTVSLIKVAVLIMFVHKVNIQFIDTLWVYTYDIHILIIKSAHKLIKLRFRPWLNNVSHKFKIFIIIEACIQYNTVFIYFLCGRKKSFRYNENCQVWSFNI